MAGHGAATAGVDLDGIGVAVTGGAGDIGAAIAAELARCGAYVYVLDRRPPPDVGWLRSTAGSRVAYVQVDVTDAAAVASALAAADPLDVVFANAGVVESAPFLDITADQWRRQVEVNLTGSFHTGQAAARLMARRGRGGRIVFTGSWVQDVPWPQIAAYSVTKAGIRMLARAMALELAPHRILVNVLAPGIVDAGMARRQRLTEPQYAARAARVVPLGTMQTAEQVGRAAAVLCSPATDYMTGAVLLVDGGASLFHFDG
jgi:NAD(P)-dependent dehydrogenase (short-subunit alcohol dehydrogenase family)